MQTTPVSLSYVTDNYALLVLNYCYICLTTFFQDNLGKLAPERQTILHFTGARDDRVAVASAGPYANHLHLAPDR